MRMSLSEVLHADGGFAMTTDVDDALPICYACIFAPHNCEDGFSAGKLDECRRGRSVLFHWKKKVNTVYVLDAPETCEHFAAERTP